MRLRHLYPLSLIFVAVVLGSVAFSQGMFSGEKNYVPSQERQDDATFASTTEYARVSIPMKTYTLADVAKHASKDNCWTAVNGSVYDLTAFTPTHPGGDTIFAICGVDGTSAFEAQHGTTRSAQSELATLKIGTLAN